MEQPNEILYITPFDLFFFLIIQFYFLLKKKSFSLPLIKSNIVEKNKEMKYEQRK